MIRRAGSICCLAFVGIVSLAAQPGQSAKRADGQPDVEGYYQTAGTAGSGGLNIEPLPNMMNSAVK